MRLFTLKSLLLLPVSAVAAGALLVLPAGSEEPPLRAAAPAAPPARPAPAPSRALTDVFGVLRRERTPADTLGSRTNGIPESDYHPAHLRRVLPAPPRGAGAMPLAGDAFVAPGPDDRMCVLVIPPGFEGPSGTCAPRRDAVTGGLTWAVNAGGGLSAVAGVVPDGVAEVILEAEGGRSSLPVAQNLYGAIVQGRPLEIRYREASGRARRIPFGG
jgi:hypothetical protein